MNSEYLEYISYFFATLSFAGAVFNSTLSIWGFYIWLISNTFHAIFNFHFEHWGYVALDLGFIATNIYGIYQYRLRNNNKTNITHITTAKSHNEELQIKRGRGRPKKSKQAPAA
jgi:nicotinamide riboside transporter PnuC